MYICLGWWHKFTEYEIKVIQQFSDLLIRITIRKNWISTPSYQRESGKRVEGKEGESGERVEGSEKRVEGKEKRVDGSKGESGDQIGESEGMMVNFIYYIDKYFLILLINFFLSFIFKMNDFVIYINF